MYLHRRVHMEQQYSCRYTLSKTTLKVKGVQHVCLTTFNKEHDSKNLAEIIHC